MAFRKQPDRSRGGVPRDRYLWLLAAILGVATVHAISSAVHDTSQRRAAALLVTRSVAEGAAVAAGARLEAAAIVALAPAIGMTIPNVRSGQGGEVVAELRREHLAAVRCRCREMMPARAFFRYDVADGALHLASADDASAVATGAPAAALATVGRRAAEAARAGATSPVRVWTDAALGDAAAATLVGRD